MPLAKVNTIDNSPSVFRLKQCNSAIVRHFDCSFIMALYHPVCRSLPEFYNNIRLVNPVLSTSMMVIANGAAMKKKVTTLYDRTLTDPKLAK